MKKYYFSPSKHIYTGLLIKKTVDPLTIDSVKKTSGYVTYEIYFKDKTQGVLDIRNFIQYPQLISYLIENHISFTEDYDSNDIKYMNYTDAVEKHNEMINKLEAFGLEYVHNHYGKEASFNIQFDESNIAYITSTFSLMIDGVQKGEAFNMDTLALVNYNKNTNESLYISTYGSEQEEDQMLKEDIEFEMEQIFR